MRTIARLSIEQKLQALILVVICLAAVIDYLV